MEQIVQINLSVGYCLYISCDLILRKELYMLLNFIKIKIGNPMENTNFNNEQCQICQLFLINYFS